MIEVSVAKEQARRERLIEAFVLGAEEEMVEIRGYGLRPEERAEFEAEAIAIYGETGESSAQ